MKYQCKFCSATFTEEQLAEWDNIPKHMVTRGTDTYSCKGGGKLPR